MDTVTVTPSPDAATQSDATIGKDPEPGRHRQRAEKMMVDEEAKALLERDCTDDYFHLRYYRGSFWFWQDGVYREVPTDDIKGQVVTELNQRYENVKRSHVDDVVMQLRGQGQLPGSIEPPAWIGDAKHPDWDPREVLATKNKLIHLPSLFTGSDYSVAPTPAFFNQAALDFDFIEGAECPPPGRWQSFLNELWPNDPEAIEALQLWVGYCLTADTRQHKMLVLVGPKRGGKGTIVRVLESLIGKANICNPTLSSFATNFGLWPLVGKTLAVVGDARLSGRTDTAVVVERLLSITGEDSLTIDRKYQKPVTCKLPTRIIIVSNELPRLADASGALAGRMILLQLHQSWFGREDHNLTDTLLGELPGILWWAIQGWKILQERGRLLQPTSGADTLQEMENLSSPIGAFIREVCIIGPDQEVQRRVLYETYVSWANDQGRAHIEDEAGFGRNLRAAIPSLESLQHRIGGRPVRYHRGVGIQPECGI